MSRQGGSGGAYLVAFVLGAVTGAALALLWAPATGEETRRLLGEKAREGKDRVSEAARNVSAAIERGRESYRQSGQKENA
jgi:gas vesicle protein